MPFPPGVMARWTRQQKLKGDARRKHIVELLLRGIVNQQAIREYLVEVGCPCSQKTCSLDIAKIKKEWKEERIDAIDTLVDREDRKLQRVESEAWAAFERSRGDSIITKSKVLTNPGRPGDRINGDPAPIELEVTRKTNCGAVEYLQLVLGCIAQRRAMLGLDKRVAPSVGVAVQVNNNGATPKLNSLQNMTLSQFRELPLSEMKILLDQQMAAEIELINETPEVKDDNGNEQASDTT